MNGASRRRRAAKSVLFVLLLLFTTSLGAQDAPSSEFAVAEVIPRVVTRHDADQQYSLYLPLGYDPAKSWPALFILDPRGRAEPTLRLFLSGAEANGWIVLSSYQSRSDTDAAVTTGAFQALLKEAERFAVDPRRLYLAGMSGTAFMAWHFAAALPDNVAGVIGCGGGLPRDLASPGDRVSFAYFGMAGTRDFNYLNQRRLDDQLAELTGAVHRFEVFDALGAPHKPSDRGRGRWAAQSFLHRALIGHGQRFWLRRSAQRASSCAEPMPTTPTPAVIACGRYRSAAFDVRTPRLTAVGMSPAARTQA